MKIKTYKEAIEYINSFIPESPGYKFPGELGLRRIEYFLSKLGNPQNKYPTIHIAGTSGKGSTSYLIANILRFAGYKTGLHVSPHLETVRERMQINGKIVPKGDFIRLINKTIPAAQLTAKSKFGRVTYYEFLLALTFLYFSLKKIEIGIIETGLGGTYDGTNVLKSKISVITPIGFDHTNILGNTLRKIAGNKAGIIKKEQAAVVSALQKREAEKVLLKKASKEKVSFFEEGKNFSVQIKKIDEKGTVFVYKDEESKIDNIFCSLLGEHQAHNAGLAIRTVKELGKTGFKINKKAIRAGLSKAFFPGRLDVRKIRGNTVILDGAHNEDKMEAIISSIKKIWPTRKIIGIIAFKDDKNVVSMIRLLSKKTEKIVVTKFSSFTDMGKYRSMDKEKIVFALGKAGFDGEVKVKNSFKEAFSEAFNKTKNDKLVLVTGSLYLVGEALKILKTKYKEYPCRS